MSPPAPLATFLSLSLKTAITLGALGGILACAAEYERNTNCEGCDELPGSTYEDRYHEVHVTSENQGTLSGQVRMVETFDDGFVSMGDLYVVHSNSNQEVRVTLRPRDGMPVRMFQYLRYAPTPTPAKMVHRNFQCHK
jgi:hypothetical protein